LNGFDNVQNPEDEISANNKTKLTLNNIIEMKKKFFVFPSQANSLIQHTQQHRLLWSTVQFSKKFENLITNPPYCSV
jgi:hypothetical protein